MPSHEPAPFSNSRKRGRGRLFKTAPDMPPVAAPAPPEPPPDMATPSSPTAVVLPPMSEGLVTAEAAAELRRPIVCPPLDTVFAPGGPVASLLGARYRPREGQVQMAALIREALQAGRHALLEAGTGIGKSFAYLIPILWAGAPAIVSTSNKALMNQLWDKDIPQLRKIAPRPFKAALLKGRSNYVCALRLDNFRKQRWLPGFDQDLELLEAALQAEPSGDCGRMALPFPLMARLTVSSRDCEGQKCKRFNHCFYERAKREAVGADLVVTNHALLCYNVLLTENQLLPVRPVLVIDEAHQLVSYAINALTLRLEHDLFWNVINHRLTREAVEETEVLGLAREAYEDFFGAVARQRPRSEDDEEASKWALRGEIQEGLALWDTLKQVQGALQRRTKTNDDGELDVLLNQSAELGATMEALARPEPEDHIRFCELEATMQGYDPRAYHAQRRPLEVAEALSRSLFKLWPRVICTSATLGVNHNLDWFRRQVGALHLDTDVSTATLASPFDYARHMLVYTPLGLKPVYGEGETVYAAKLADEVRRLVETSQGRALVLCTSRKRMTDLYERLSPLLSARYPCYCQGELPQPEIIARFEATGNAVIFATRSFWEGIDIPGEALALVILDKIPFLPFQDPVVQRHDWLINKRGGNPFQELQLGSAILA
ncbi:MAG: ATP-dependent DNA helicase, partial [Anaerolineae bacterium]|nr:ATP-dependent DNA helicase [Anaerolineae bacterium]